MKKSEAKGAKKKYALIDKENNIVVKGFETIRRDWSFLAKEVQAKVLEIILKENSPKKAYQYVRKVINDVRDKKYKIKDMIIQTQLKKAIESYEAIGPHVEIAKRMKKLGLYAGPGSIMRYVVTEGKGLIRDKARLPEEAKNYDQEYYINNQILPSVEKIFDVLGYSKEEIKHDHKQKKLDSF